MTAFDETDGITELEKFEPTRVDGVDLPANGASWLMLKALAPEAPAKADPAPKEPTETAKAVAAVPEAETQPEAPQDTAPPAPEEASAPAPQETAKSAADPHPLDVIRLPASPADIAKLKTLRQRLAVAEAATKAAARAAAKADEQAVKRDFDPNVGGGVDRDKLPARDFAGPHRSYPIDKPGDVSDAAHSLGRAKGGAKERAAIKAKIIAIARRKGKAYVDQLPEAWKDKTAKAEAAKADARQCPSCKEFSKPDAAECEHCGQKMAKAGKPKGKKKPFPGAAPPYKAGNSGHDAPRPDPAKDDSEGGKAAKAGCPCKCGSAMAKDAKFCSACGAPAGGKAAKGKKPFPADAKVGQAISRLEGDADAALDAQAKDPDAKTHPADRKVTAELERVKADVEAAADAQDHDEATDTPEGHDEAAKAAQDPEGPAYHLRRLHDATCAAYAAEDVILAHPSAAKGIGGLVDPQSFAAMTQAALAEDGGTGTRARDIPALSEAFRHSVALKALAASGGLDEAMEDLRKSFAAYYPDAHPKPGSISPGQFHRPYVSAGHANQSAKPSQKPRIPMSDHVPDPADFRRPLITDGREAASPGSDPRPNGLGKAQRKAAKRLEKARTYYRNSDRDNAGEVLVAMHDWIADNHPHVCPMRGATYDGEPGQPGSMGSSLSTAKPVPAVLQATRAEAAPRPVDRGEMSRNEGHMGKHKAAKAAGKAGKMPKNAAGKTRKAAPAAPASPLIDPEMLKGLFRESAADLLGDVTKTLGDLTTRIAELESAPDPAQMAPRSGMAAVAKGNAGHEVPAGGDGHEAERIARLAKRAADPDGSIRVAAISELFATVGREDAVKLLEAVS